MKTRTVRNFVVLACAVGLTVAGAGPGAAAAPTAPAPRAATPTIIWGPCDDAGLQEAGGQCGLLAVPLDHSHPTGPKIHLAVSRVRHKTPDADFQGIMLINPGGPGVSGLGLSTFGQYVPNGGGDAYDWIGFDPRGIGSSKPAVSCIADYNVGPRPEYVPVTRSLERTWRSRAQSYAAACGRNGGALLDHMSTADSAKDMDSIRAALGQRQINFYGYSYGTYLGQVYATLYPERVRRMVLDSNVDPRKVWYRANLGQDVAFQRNIEIWFGWLARFDSVYHLGTTRAAVEKRWYAEQAKLRGHPAGGVVGPAEWTDVFLNAAYFQFLWTTLADAFAGWAEHGDSALLVDLYRQTDSPGNDNGYFGYLAVECSDARWPTTFDQVRRDNWLTFLRAPYATWANAWFNGPCLSWPSKHRTPVDVSGARVPGILLIDETLDAPTPFEGSLEVRRRFPNASLIAEPGGTTHAASLFGNACVDDQIADYLLTGHLPPRKPGNGPDTLCEPLPQPDPTAVTASTASSPSTLSARVDGLERLRLRPVRP